MLYFSKKVAFLAISGLFFSIQVHSQPKGSILYEANKQAMEGNVETAFNILSTDAKKGDCNALGLYWQWALNYSYERDYNSLKFAFNSAIPRSNNLLVAKQFSYQFEAENHILTLANRCPSNGLVNKAAGMYYLLLEANNAAVDYTDSVHYYLGIAIKTGAYDTFTLYHYATTLQAKSKYLEAIYYFKRAYDLDDGQLKNLLGVAASQAQLYKYDSAIAYAKQALLFSAENDITTKALSTRIMANAYSEMGNNKLAKNYFKQSFGYDADRFDTHLSYFRFLAQTKPNKGCKQGKKLINQFYTEEVVVKELYKYLSLAKADKVVESFLSNSNDASAKSNVAKWQKVYRK